MAPRHIVAAVIFGVAIGLGMHYVLGGNPWIHMGIAVIGALAGTWFAVRNKPG
jgi:F0F1-type ATP synthase assembly protein I